jgi:hypothetical protein
MPPPLDSAGISSSPEQSTATPASAPIDYFSHIVSPQQPAAVAQQPAPIDYFSHIVPPQWTQEQPYTYRGKTQDEINAEKEALPIGSWAKHPVSGELRQKQPPPPDADHETGEKINYFGEGFKPAPEPPSITGEVWRGLERGAASLFENVFQRPANAIEKHLLVPIATAISPAFGEQVRQTAEKDAAVEFEMEKRIADATAPGVGGLSQIGGVGDAIHYAAGKAGEALPILMEFAATRGANLAALPVFGAQGAISGGTKGYEETGGNVPAALAGAGAEAALNVAPAHLIMGAAGQPLGQAVGRGALAMAGIGAAGPVAERIPKAIAAGNVSQLVPTAGEEAEAAASGAIAGSMFGGAGSLAGRGQRQRRTPTQVATAPTTTAPTTTAPSFVSEGFPPVGSAVNVEGKPLTVQGYATVNGTGVIRLVEPAEPDVAHRMTLDDFAKRATPPVEPSGAAPEAGQPAQPQAPLPAGEAPGIPAQVSQGVRAAAQAEAAEPGVQMLPPETQAQLEGQAVKDQTAIEELAKEPDKAGVTPPHEHPAEAAGAAVEDAHDRVDHLMVAPEQTEQAAALAASQEQGRTPDEILLAEEQAKLPPGYKILPPDAQNPLFSLLTPEGEVVAEAGVPGGLASHAEAHAGAEPILPEYPAEAPPAQVREERPAEAAPIEAPEAPPVPPPDVLAEAPSTMGAAGRGLEESRVSEPIDPLAEPSYRDLRAGFPEHAEDPHGTARNWAMEQGEATGHEHLVAYDPATGEITHAYTMSLPDAVGISPDLVRRLDDPNAAIILHHNHAENSLSGQDVSELGSPGLDSIVAHTKDGSTFVARLTPEAKMMALNDPDGARETIKGLYDAAAMAVTRRLMKIEMTDAKANYIHADLVNRALDAAGLIDYMSSRRVALPDALTKNIIRDAVAEVHRMADEAGVPLPGKEEVDARIHRSTLTVRPDESMGRLSGPDDANAGDRSGYPEAPSDGRAGIGAPGEARVATEGTAAGRGLAEETPDLSERATEDTLEQAGIIPGQPAPPGSFTRLRRMVGDGPGTPQAERKDFAVLQKSWTLFTTKGATDPMSAPKVRAELDKRHDTDAFRHKYGAITEESWKDQPLESMDKIFGVLELNTLQGTKIPLDGRTIIAENMSHPMATKSKVGDIIMLSPHEGQMLADYVKRTDTQWQDAEAETGKLFGWHGEPNVAAVQAAIDAATSLRQKEALRRAYDVMAAIEFHRRESYLPLMRDGDHFIRVTPRVGLSHEFYEAQEAIKARPDAAKYTPDQIFTMARAEVRTRNPLANDAHVEWNGEGKPPPSYFTLMPSLSLFQRAKGGFRSGTPEAVAKRIAELREHYPESDYDIDHGPFDTADAVKDLDIPVIEKLMVLTGSGIRSKIQNRLTDAGMSPDAAASKAREEFKDLQDSVLNTIKAERVAGPRRQRQGIPGYSGDFINSTRKYTNWLSAHNAALKNSEAIDQGNRIMYGYTDDDGVYHPGHPDKQTQSFMRNWDRRQEDFGDDLVDGPLMRARHGAFLYFLGANFSSTMKFLLHGPSVGIPTMSLGLGAKEGSISAGNWLAAIGGVMKGTGVGKEGLKVDLMSGARDAAERALVADSEARGITHAQQAAELSGRGEQRGETDLQPRQHLLKQFFDAWGSNIHWADRVTRGGMLLGAYRTARRVGMDRINAIWDQDLLWRNEQEKTPERWAQFMVEKTSGIPGNWNKMPLMRGALGGTIGQFRTYEVTWMSNLWANASRMGPGGKIAAAIQLGALGLMGGMAAQPFIKEAEKAANFVYGMIMGIDPDFETSLRDAFDVIAPEWGETLVHGFRPFGVDLGSGIGFGDPISRYLQDFADLFGALPGAVMKQPYRAWERANTGQGPLAASEELLPVAVRHMLQALYPETAVAAAATGKPMMDPNQLSDADKLKIGLGFQPAAKAIQGEEIRRTSHAFGAYKAALDKAENRIANLRARGEPIDEAMSAWQNLIRQGMQSGALPMRETAIARRDLMLKLRQRLHPEIPSKLMQRMQPSP